MTYSDFERNINILDSDSDSDGVDSDDLEDILSDRDSD